MYNNDLTKQSSGIITYKGIILSCTKIGNNINIHLNGTCSELIPSNTYIIDFNSVFNGALKTLCALDILMPSPENMRLLANDIGVRFAGAVQANTPIRASINFASINFDQIPN